MGSYKRILLKLSGEALAGEQGFGFDEANVRKVGAQIKELTERGVQVAIVIGGGNFMRGRACKSIDRTKADSIGMLATVMNCIYVSEILRTMGLSTKVFTPFACSTFTELFSKDRAVEALKEGKVVFLGGGTGHPYFSTDTGTSLRAIELECDCIVMAKAVDGIYDSDPVLNPNAKKYDKLTYTEILTKQLKAVDLTASVLCMENNMPMILFDLNQENSIVKNVLGSCTGTVVEN